MPTVTVNNVLSARERIRSEVRTTPLIQLPVRGVPDLFAKAESLQRTGSFKLRGAYNFLASLPADVRARGVVAQSSGNHAQGVACAAFLLGVPATIVIPEGAPAVKVERTRSWGARIVRCGNSADDREAAA
jgi:threonine dehydratase